MSLMNLNVYLRNSLFTFEVNHVGYMSSHGSTKDACTVGDLHFLYAAYFNMVQCNLGNVAKCVIGIDIHLVGSDKVAPFHVLPLQRFIFCSFSAIHLQMFCLEIIPTAFDEMNRVIKQCHFAITELYNPFP